MHVTVETVTLHGEGASSQNPEVSHQKRLAVQKFSGLLFTTAKGFLELKSSTWELRRVNFRKSRSQNIR